jgi:hypothetical protein
MNDPNNPGASDDQPVVPSDSSDRKPYEKPAFVREQVFETMALACGKINPTTGACRAVKKAS